MHKCVRIVHGDLDSLGHSDTINVLIIVWHLFVCMIFYESLLIFITKLHDIVCFFYHMISHLGVI